MLPKTSNEVLVVVLKNEDQNKPNLNKTDK